MTSMPISNSNIPYAANNKKVGAVEINIINPVANGYACPATQTPPDNNTGGTQQPPAGPHQPPDNPVKPKDGTTQPPQGPEKPPIGQTPINDDKNKDKKNIIKLTDDYIKSLENFLNSQNTTTRVTGIKALIDRFKEDKSRMNDQALTNLLNKALQDPTPTVRAFALNALDKNYATGDELTYKILQKIQSQKDKYYNGDAELAGRILLNKSGQNINIQDTPENSQPPVKQGQKTGNKLNVMAG